MPQRRVLFRHLISKNRPTLRRFVHFLTWKCSSRYSGVYFFDILISKKGAREWCVLYIFTWVCASRHNGVQFFISHLPRCLRTCRFSEPFSTLRSHKLLEDTGIRPFPTFSRICIFFLLSHSLYSSFFSLFCFLFVRTVEFDEFGISETCKFSGILVLRDCKSYK